MNKKELMLTQELLKEFLNYNSDTGIFTWIKLQGKSNRQLGDKAGCTYSSNGKKYISIRINANIYQAHRLAVLYMTGKWPDNEVDHADGNGLNNKWGNLSLVTGAENKKNVKLFSNNKSGHAGISWHKKLMKWQAQISVNKKMIYLGVFVEIDEAIEVRKIAEKKYGFHPNHGQDRPL